MKKLKAKIRRFIFMVKAWVKTRKMPKFIRKVAFWHSVSVYDTQEYLKTLKPIGGELLDFAAANLGIKRNGMTDAALRAKITDTILGVRKEASRQ